MVISALLPEFDDAFGGGLAAEAAEHLGVDDPDAGAGQHGDGKLRHHRHVEGDPIAGNQATEVAEQRGDLVHPPIELLIGDVLYWLVFEFRNEMDRGLVPVLRKMAVDAIV